MVIRLCALACLVLVFLSPACHALSIIYPGEGIKTVVSAAGEQIQRAVDADNDAARAVKGVIDTVNPNTWGAHFDRFDLDLTLSAYKNQVSGNKTRSFLDEGTQTQEQMDLGVKRRYLAFGGGEFEFKSTLRATADPQVDAVKNTRLQGLHATFSRPDDYSLRLGNVSGSFSSYSLSASANVGAQLTKQLGATLGFDELQVYLGRPTRHLERTSFNRYVYGLRLSGLRQEQWEELNKFGISWVKTKDDVESISDTSARPANAVENEVVAFDAGFKFSDDVTVQMEWAHSKTDPNTQSSAADLIRGYAYKLNGAARLLPRFGFDATSAALSYEEIDPDFRSTSGGGSPDARRMTLGLNSGRKLAGNMPDLTLSYSGSTNRNNLEGQLARRTTSTVHNWNLAFKPFQKMREGTGRRQGTEKSTIQIGDEKAEAKSERRMLSPAMREHWDNIRKNMSATAAFGINQTQASDNSAKSQIGNQSYQLATASGQHTLSTFYRYQITQEKTAATGDRRNASQGLTYGYREIEWTFPLYPDKPFKTGLNLNATRTRDKTMDAAGRSDQRQYGAGAQTQVNETERLDVDYSLGLTDNLNAASDIRTENWKFGYVVQKFIRDEGNLTLSYTSKKTEEENAAQDYREEVWRLDAALSWGGPSEEVVASRTEAEDAVKEILNVFAGEDIFAFMVLISPNFKENRITFENQVRDRFNLVDNIRYEGVWVSSFVPGDAVTEVTFRWQRRWRVYATGAEERAEGTALFRIEKSADNRWLLQEIRQTSPFF